jgi:hypothetical protein
MEALERLFGPMVAASMNRRTGECREPLGEPAQKRGFQRTVIGFYD